MTTPRLFLLVAAALLVAAPLAAAPTNRSPGKKQNAAKALCNLAHYPVAVGLTNEHQITAMQLDADGRIVEKNTSSYTDEIVAVEANGFRTKSTSEGNTSASEWICTEEGISLKYAEYPETKITATGTVVPATMEVGGSWNHSFSMEAPGVSQTSKTVNRVTRREMVEVPAGTFEAFRIDYEIETLAEGQEPSAMRGTQWFVTSVGIVKSVSVIPVAMEQTRSVETVLELIKQTTK